MIISCSTQAIRRMIFGACLFFCFLGSSTAALVTSDFSFGSGTPFGGTTTLDGVNVTLSTTNTQPFGGTSFRDLLNTDPAFVTLSFDTPISEFFLSISFVLPPDEFLTDFNIGDPTSLTGDLVNIGGQITSSVPGDGGNGTLFWSGLNTATVSFTIGNLITSTASPALAVDEFGINAAPIVGVPVVSPLLLIAPMLIWVASRPLRRSNRA